MGNFPFRRLDQFRTGGSRDNMELRLPLPQSSKGRTLRYCPNDSCVPRRFQLGAVPTGQKIDDDNLKSARRLPGSLGTTCPYCGTDADDEAYIAPEDIDHAKKTVIWAAREDIGDWAKKLAQDFNRRSPRGGLISMSMGVKRSPNPRPSPWREDLLRALTCDICGRDYGVYAIALFCPDCGSRNVHVHFKREVELVERQVEISQFAANEGDEELGFRLLGNAHEDVLTALETYLRTLFLFLAWHRLNETDFAKASKEARRGNPFQTIGRSEALFKRLGIAPFGVLKQGDRDFMAAHIEKRHVIGHNLGLADEKYLRGSGEEAEGENIRLLGDDVRRFAGLAFRVVVEGLEGAASEFLPPSN
jgi:hypothetical protein